MEALKSPSADHAQIYAALGIVLAAAAFLIAQAVKPAKADPELMFTLDQVVDDPKQQEEKEQDNFFKELSSGKPYASNLSGTLQPDALLKLRSIINKRAY